MLRRPVLHLTACAVVVIAGVVGGRRVHYTVAPPDVPLQVEAPMPTDVSVSEPGVAALLVLPQPTVAVLETGNAATPSEPDTPLAIRTYTVEEGDSVRTIAKQFGVTNETIIWENDLTDPDVLQVGQDLRILPFSGLIHEVRPGDTVASVANAYDALVQDVISANKLTDPYIIVVGQKLAVPGGYRPLPQRVVLAPSPKPDTVQAPPDQDSDQVAAVVTAPKHTLPTLGNTPQEQFISSIAEAAVESADQTGVPASVTIAQAILESYWGSSRLAHDANNYFGIKAQTRGGSAGSLTFDVWEVIGGRNVVQTQAFRAYNTVAESFVDHGLFFMENSRYASAMAVKDDPKQFAVAINRDGYATDPSYASKLIGLMDRYNLYRYDDV
ncbi:MAG: glucosaminidase domain-containing protein [Chloroflexi bacterium]|nr:glucosaminidase domain-containing protein [Chloroflexota bacterium]